MFPEKLGFRQGGLNAPGQWVSYIHGCDTAGAEELLLEGEDAEQAVDDAAHGFGASLAPGPDLRRDEVDDRHVQFAEAGGDAEVEVRRVGQDGELGAALGGGCDQAAEFFINPWDMVDYFNQSYNRDAFSSNDGFDPGGAEPGACAAEELGVRMAAAEFVDQQRGVAVA